MLRGAEQEEGIAVRRRRRCEEGRVQRGGERGSERDEDGRALQGGPGMARRGWEGTAKTFYTNIRHST